MKQYSGRNTLKKLMGKTYLPIKGIQDKIGNTDISNIGDGTITSAIKSLNDNVKFPDNVGFYLDIKNGVRGYNTSANRGADTFFPFNLGGSKLSTAKLLLSDYWHTNYSGKINTTEDYKLIISAVFAIDVSTGTTSVYASGNPIYRLDNIGCTIANTGILASFRVCYQFDVPKGTDLEIFYRWYGGGCIIGFN